MKRFLLIASFLALSVCNAFPQNDADSKAVSAAVKSGNLEICINTIYPQAGMPVHDSGYSLRISNGKVTTVLPFFGTSDTASFSHEDSSIVLNDAPVKIRKKKNGDSWSLEFDAQSGNNNWTISVIIWDNGRCDLTCQCSSKSLMRYDGELAL